MMPLTKGRRAITLLLCALAAPVLAEVRYVQPNLGRLMLNEVINTGGDARYALYLDKPGRFYGEVMFDGAACAVSGPTLEFTVSRGVKTQWRRQVSLRLEPNQPHQTLFWFDAPDDMPYRTALDLAVTPHPAAPTACSLRLQITRKFQPPLIVPR